MKAKRFISAILAAAMAVPASATALAYNYTYGDVNADGVVSVADLVRLQNFLMKGDMRQLYNADLNEDGKVDIFDFCMLRQMFTDKTAEPVYTSTNIAADYQSAGSQTVAYSDEFKAAQTKFAVELFRHELADVKNQERNTMISPYSVMQALAMTANGAAGQTLSEMEQALGGMPIEELNPALYTLRMNQPDGMDANMSTANSIWAERGLSVSPDFLATDVKYYNADFFTTIFDDNALNDVNSWVNNKTKERIPKVLNEFPPNTKMLLINAVTFDAKWASPINSVMTKKSDFHNFDGETAEVDMMYFENHSYIHDDNAQGFIKEYAGNYAFAALLPNEGMSVQEYADTLTAEGFGSMIKNRSRSIIVDVHMPKFKYSFDNLLNNSLMDMGMTTAFTENADFSKLTTDNNDIYVGSVFHKTFIDLDEAGTSAAAVTVVIAPGNAMDPIEKDIRYITLDRPFVYVIYDTETNIPIFMGTVVKF